MNAKTAYHTAYQHIRLMNKITAGKAVLPGSFTKIAAAVAGVRLDYYIAARDSFNQRGGK